METAIQAAIYTALNGNIAASVYDNVPKNANYPYVTIGDDSHLAWDTDTTLGAETTITLHVWSRYDGMKEAKDIQASIYSILHRANLSVSGYTLVTIDFVQSDIFIDADGFTRHGAQTFRILLDEV